MKLVNTISLHDSFGTDRRTLLRDTLNSEKEHGPMMGYIVKCVAIKSRTRWSNEDDTKSYVEYKFDVYGEEFMLCQMLNHTIGNNKWYNSKGELFYFCDAAVEMLMKVADDVVLEKPNVYRVVRS